MNKPTKSTPKFTNEVQERTHRESHGSAEHIQRGYALFVLPIVNARVFITFGKSES
jgi:hypothetical protein